MLCSSAVRIFWTNVKSKSSSLENSKRYFFTNDLVEFRDFPEVRSQWTKLESEFLRWKSLKNHLKWYQTRTNFMGVRQWKSILWLLRGRLSSWLFMSKLCTKIKRCGRKFRIFDIYVVSEGDKGKKVSNEKPTKNWKLRRLKLRRLTGNQMSTPNFIYKMTSVIRYTHWVNLGVKRPRNWKKNEKLS